MYITLNDGNTWKKHELCIYNRKDRLIGINS